MAEKVKVILFKPSGKYYTSEEWEIPEKIPRDTGFGTRGAVAPYDMQHSLDFRRIDGGHVLIPEQEPWGYPHLFPGRSE